MSMILAIISVYFLYRWSVWIDKTPDDKLTEFEKYLKYYDDNDETTYPGYTVKRKKKRR